MRSAQARRVASGSRASSGKSAAAAQPAAVRVTVQEAGAPSEEDASRAFRAESARALADACVTLEHFENGAYLDAGIAPLLGRVHVAAYGNDRFPPDNHFGAEVRVTLRDGSPPAKEALANSLLA